MFDKSSLGLYPFSLRSPQLPSSKWWMKNARKRSLLYSKWIPINRSTAKVPYTFSLSFSFPVAPLLFFSLSLFAATLHVVRRILEFRIIMNGLAEKRFFFSQWHDEALQFFQNGKSHAACSPNDRYSALLGRQENSSCMRGNALKFIAFTLLAIGNVFFT